MPDPDPNVIASHLSHTVTLDGITVEVQIYRLEHETEWMLEVVNEVGTSTVWDDPFETEEAAFEAFRQALEDEGIETFLQGGDADTLH